MSSYLTVKDFRPRLNKKGEEYGWAVAIYTLPNTYGGIITLPRAIRETPEDSYKKIIRHIRKNFDTDEDTVRKIV